MFNIAFIFRSSIIYLLTIIFIHKLFIFFKDTLTTPIFKDCIKTPMSKYEDIFNNLNTYVESDNSTNKLNQLNQLNELNELNQDSYSLSKKKIYNENEYMEGYISQYLQGELRRAQSPTPTERKFVPLNPTEYSPTSNPHPNPSQSIPIPCDPPFIDSLETHTMQESSTDTDMKNYLKNYINKQLQIK